MRIDPWRCALASLAFSCAGVLLPGVACAADVVRMSAAQAQALGIETAPLVSQTGASGTGLPAQVVIPNNQIQVVSAPLAGLVQNMAVAVNDPVKAGQVLARLDSPALIEAQRGFVHAAVRAQLAQEALSRDEQLYKEGIIARGRYLATRAEAVQAAAGLSEGRQRLRLYGMSEGGIDRLRRSGRLSGALDIVSPLDGVVLEQMATAGQRAEAASPLYKVARLDPLWIDIRVPVGEAGGIAPGAPVSVAAAGATGSVLSVGRQVDAANQTITVRAIVAKGAERLRPGQLVEATLQLAQSGGKEWRVPNGAIVRRQEKAYVFVQAGDGFRAEAVTVVNQSAESATIAGPLQEGERIAVKGLAALKASWVGLGGGQ